MSTWIPPPPFTRDADGFVLPNFDERKFPYLVAVCGGVGYTAAYARFVRSKVATLVFPKTRTHNVHFHLAPTPGAAEVVGDWAGDHYRHRTVYLARELWGRAAEFRAAWQLLDCVNALIVFEPLDLIARYALRLASQVPDRAGVEGRGIAVRVVPRTNAVRGAGRG